VFALTGRGIGKHLVVNANRPAGRHRLLRTTGRRTSARWG
jgi:hypothetical protein